MGKRVEEHLPEANPWAKEPLGLPPRRFPGKSDCRSALSSTYSPSRLSPAAETLSPPGNTWSSADSWVCSIRGAIKSQLERNPPSLGETATPVTIWNAWNIFVSSVFPTSTGRTFINIDIQPVAVPTFAQVAANISVQILICRDDKLSQEAIAGVFSSYDECCTFS